jgi:hypothetical protein
MSILETKFNSLCQTPSDINEHLDAISKFASECDTIVELGVRVPISTFALLMGKPKKLISVDIKHPSNFPGGAEDLNLAAACAKEENIDFSFILNDSISYDFESCDLLFIDTWHTYRQLYAELITHQSKVSKYIILHDTTSYAECDEYNWADSPEPTSTELVPLYNGKTGLWTAVEDFLEKYTEWEVHTRYTHNNGVTVLKRVS